MSRDAIIIVKTGDDTARERIIRYGGYYWLKVRSLALRAQEWQPGRFTGMSLDSGGILTWDYIGQRCDDGHHYVEVVEIGEEIVR